MTIIKDTIKIQRKAALTVGIALLIMTISAGISYGFIHSKLIINSNPETTLLNLVNSINLFRIEILGWFIILVCDVIISIALYYYFLNTNKFISKISMILRLIYSVFLGVAISYLLKILFYLKNDILSNKLMDDLAKFDSFWSIGLIIFGLHLFALSILMFRTFKMPKVLSVLMLLAAISYFLVHLLYLFLPVYSNSIHSLENMLSLPMAVGELGFGIWLLFKGGRKPLFNPA